VADSWPRGHWFKSPLKQFVLKTRAVNFILGNRNMMGKIPTRWENSDRGNRKTAGKNSAMVGNLPQWEKKSLPLHGSFSTAAPVLYAGNYLPLFSQCVSPQTPKHKKLCHFFPRYAEKMQHYKVAKNLVKVFFVFMKPASKTQKEFTRNLCYIGRVFFFFTNFCVGKRNRHLAF
jgi:hypothetical protein